MSFVMGTLSCWVSFSRVRKVPKAQLTLGNACDYLSTLKQVTSSLQISVSSRRREIEIAVKDLSLPPLIYQDSILSCRLNSQSPRAFPFLLLEVYMAQISPWVSSGAYLPILLNSVALQVMTLSAHYKKVPKPRTYEEVSYLSQTFIRSLPQKLSLIGFTQKCPCYSHYRPQRPWGTKLKEGSCCVWQCYCSRHHYS